MRCRWHYDGVAKFICCVILAILLDACAFNGTGTVSKRNLKTRHATVIEHNPVGIQLRTKCSDTGITIGVTKRRYFYAVNSEPSFIKTAISADDARIGKIGCPDFVHVRGVGLALDFVSSGMALTLGYWENIGIKVEAGRSLRILLAYVPGDLAATEFKKCEGNEKCW